MSKDYQAASLDQVAAEVVRPTQGGEVMGAPRFAGDFECYGPEGLKWRDHFENVVCSQGRYFLLNRVFNSHTASTAGCFLQLHAANATNSAHSWGDLSASRVTGYGNDVPKVSLTTTYATTAQTMSASYGFNATATQQTVSGAAVLFYTSASMSSNAAAGDCLLYSEGNFGTTRTVTGADTLNVTLTVAFA